MRNFYKHMVLMLCAVLFAGCVPKEEYEQAVEESGMLMREKKRLEEKVAQLETEIALLKETDQYYYQSGADEFSQGNYERAIDWMNRLKTRFPQSTLVTAADKLIKDSNAAVAAIYQGEKTGLNTLLANAKKAEIEDAIALLSAYVIEKHPADLIERATESLAQYKSEYEKVKTEREFEKSLGIRLTDYYTGWNMRTFFGGQKLFVPNIALKFKNMSEYTLPMKTIGKYNVETTTYIEIKVTFIQTSNHEVFGDDSSYLVGYGDSLQPGYFKTVYIDCPRGYTREWKSYELDDLPNIEANIYINDQLYKTIPIKKGYRNAG